MPKTPEELEKENRERNRFLTLWGILRKSKTPSKKAEELIVDYDLNPHGTEYTPTEILMACIQTNNINAIKRIHLHTEIDKTSARPITKALGIGATTCVKNLISLGFSPDGKDENNSRPLDIAARAGLTGMVKLLLKIGVKPDEINYLDLSDAAVRQKEGAVYLILNTYSLDKISKIVKGEINPFEIAKAHLESTSTNPTSIPYGRWGYSNYKDIKRASNFILIVARKVLEDKKISNVMSKIKKLEENIEI